MATKAIIGIDVGATSIKVGAFDDGGRQLALAVRANHFEVRHDRDGLITWSEGPLRKRVFEALREVNAALPGGARTAAVAVSGFGADGAPFACSGEQLYPIISWHEGRTEPVARWITEHAGAGHIYQTTGYHSYPMNTISRWRWLVEHEPRALHGATWLMVPDIVRFWLSGEFLSDPTSASTTMAFDVGAGGWSHELLRTVEVPLGLPARCGEPGTQSGVLTREAELETGLPAGTPVIVAGHDCEVGTYAAGGDTSDGTLVDIAGTWEILLAVLEVFSPTSELYDSGIDWERHTIEAQYLCLSLMPAGGVLQWIRDLAFPGNGAWEAMVAEAQAAGLGAGGVILVPAFVGEVGPLASQGVPGTVVGLRTTTTRGQLARAALEGLCYELRSQVGVLERATGRDCCRLRVLGGGHRNDLWLQLKADVTGREVEAVMTPELTALGAALIGGVGAGIFTSLAEAQTAVKHPVRRFEPDAVRRSQYDELFDRFRSLPQALAGLAAPLPGVM